MDAACAVAAEQAAGGRRHRGQRVQALGISHGGIALLRTSHHPWPVVTLCYADRAYAGPHVANATPVRVELFGPIPDQRGFAVQPRRWVIERTFAWTARCRRLARDHEATLRSAVAFFVLAAATVLLRRLAKAF